MDNNVVSKPFGMRDKLGYMFGDFGNDFTFILSSSFLMVFYTKVLGISAAMVAILFLVARIVDAFTDVTMGRLVDTLPPAKDGRFLSWIRRMAGPVALASFLMYQSGMASQPMNIKIIYMFVTYLLWGSICYTAVNIPYGSMASVISSNPDDRAALSTFRSLGATLANLCINVLVPMVIYVSDANGKTVMDGGRMTMVAGVCSVLAIVCYIACYKMSTERIKIVPDKNAPKVSLAETFLTLAKNKALMGLILAAICLLLKMLLTGTINQYLFTDYLNSRESLATMNLVGMIPTFLLVPFVVVISKKFGKRESGAIATILAGVSYIVLYILGVKSPVVYIGIAMVGYFGYGYFNLIIWALITDVIDYQEVRTGKRDDGTVYAVYSFSRKIGQAIAGGLGGFALAAVGYDSAVQAQSPEVAKGIYNIATLAPGIAYIAVGLILWFLYPLSKKVVEENVATLNQRHGK